MKTKSVTKIKKFRSGNLTIELILMLPLWLLLIFYISMEVAYSHKVTQLEDDLRIVLRNASKIETDGVDYIHEKLDSLNYDRSSYYINLYRYNKEEKTFKLVTDGTGWEVGNLIEVVLTAKTNMAKQGFTNFTVNGEEFNFPRTICTVESRMLIEGKIDVVPDEEEIEIKELGYILTPSGVTGTINYNSETKKFKITAILSEGQGLIFTYGTDVLSVQNLIINGAFSNKIGTDETNNLYIDYVYDSDGNPTDVIDYTNFISKNGGTYELIYDPLTNSLEISFVE